MRNRSRETGAPVLLTNLRRIEIVPCEERCGLHSSDGAAHCFRTRFGSADASLVGSAWWAPTCENFLMVGLARFSGPGAPSTGVGMAPLIGTFAVVETG